MWMALEHDLNRRDGQAKGLEAGLNAAKQLE